MQKQWGEIANAPEHCFCILVHTVATHAFVLRDVCCYKPEPTI